MESMAPPPARKGMRLSVKVLALEAENAHGLYRDEAIAAFQEKNLALPVNLDDTLEQVWARIEQRYKANYLSPAQRAAFTIKRLQDAYDCDLDLGDTVGAIFEGETDPSKRMIKVVPSYVNRDFSVPVTSKLIPGHLQQARKRHRENSEGRSSKRRRSELRQLENVQENVNVARDQPIPSTESGHSEEDGVGHTRVTGNSRRSHSANSLVFVNGGQTGQTEFGLDIKEEFTEPGHPSEQTATPATTAISPDPEQWLAKPLVPASQPSKIQSSIPLRASSEDIPIPQFDDEVLETDYLGSDDAQMRDVLDSIGQEVDISPEVDTQEAVINQSPKSTPQAPELTPPPATKRRDVYDVPSSPEFLIPSSKSKKTYGRSPHNSKMLQKGADLLNQSRLLKAGSDVQEKSLSEKAHAFQLPRPDEIESTPKEAADSNSQHESSAEADDNVDLTNAFLDDITCQTPSKDNSTQAPKPGSLKKPSTKPPPVTPARARRNLRSNSSNKAAQMTPAQQKLHVEKNTTPASSNGFKEVKLTPKNQARLMSLKKKVGTASSLSTQARAASPMAVVQGTSRSNSSHSQSKANPAGKEIPTSAQVESTVEPTQNHNSPSQAEGPIPNNTAQLSAEGKLLQRTPIKSPIPLPANVRSATPRGNTVSKNDTQTTGDVGTFKKPAPRLSSSRSQGPRSQSSERRRSTPLRNEVLLAGSPKQLAKPASDASIRRLSGSSNLERAPIRSEVPLPSNVRRSISTTSSQAAQQGNAVERVGRSNVKAKSSTPVEAPAKRRGRASQVSVSSPTPDPEVIPTAQVTANSKPAKSASKSTPVAKTDAEQPLVISSGESSTDYSDSDEEEEPLKTTQGLNWSLDKRGSQVEQANGLTKGGSDAVVQNGTSAQEETAQNTAAPWNTKSWGFQGLDPFDGKNNQSNGEPTSGQAEGSVHPESEAGADADTISQSGSAAASTRSSPVVSRAPARFLSHTPTPDASESEDDPEETVIAPSKPAPANTQPESDSDSSSDTSSDEEDEEDEDEKEQEEDIEMPNVSVEPSSAIIPSSPPPSRKPPPSTPFVPPTSQIPASSQSVSAQASDRRRRPLARGGYGSYKTITEQLKMVESQQPLALKKPFDPRTANLTSLLAGGKKTPGLGTGGAPARKIVLGVGLGNDDDDDDDDSDESSSSSSSDGD